MKNKNFEGEAKKINFGIFFFFFLGKTLGLGALHPKLAPPLDVGIVSFLEIQIPKYHIFENLNAGRIVDTSNQTPLQFF